MDKLSGPPCTYFEGMKAGKPEQINADAKLRLKVEILFIDIYFMNNFSPEKCGHLISWNFVSNLTSCLFQLVSAKSINVLPAHLLLFDNRKKVPFSKFQTVDEQQISNKSKCATKFQLLTPKWLSIQLLQFSYEK